MLFSKSGSTEPDWLRVRREAEVPAMLYAVQKQLLYHSISNLEPAVYQAPDSFRHAFWGARADPPFVRGLLRRNGAQIESES